MPGHVMKLTMHLLRDFEFDVEVMDDKLYILFNRDYGITNDMMFMHEAGMLGWRVENPKTLYHSM